MYFIYAIKNLEGVIMIRFIRKHFPRSYCNMVERRAIKIYESLRYERVSDKYFKMSLFYGITRLLGITLLLLSTYFYLTTGNAGSNYSFAVFVALVLSSFETLSLLCFSKLKI